MSSQEDTDTMVSEPIPRIYRQNTHPASWECFMCGNEVGEHLYLLTRHVCKPCTPEYLETLKIVWFVPGHDLLPNYQQLINSNIVQGTHISKEKPDQDAQNLGLYHSDVYPNGFTLAYLNGHKRKS